MNASGVGLKVWGRSGEFCPPGRSGLGFRDQTQGLSLGHDAFSTLRFMGSYKWRYKSPNIGYTYNYPTYNPTYNYP